MRETWFPSRERAEGERRRSCLDALNELQAAEHALQLVAERDAGRGVLLVSLELDEILSLSDRILVIYEGRIAGEYSPDVSEEELGIAMTGGGREEVAA